MDIYVLRQNIFKFEKNLLNILNFNYREETVLKAITATTHFINKKLEKFISNPTTQT